MSKIKSFFTNLEEKVKVLYDGTLYAGMICGGNVLLGALLFYMYKKIFLYPYLSEGMFLLAVAILGGALFSYCGVLKSVIINNGGIYRPLKFNRYWGMFLGISIGLVLVVANVLLNNGSVRVENAFFSSNAVAMAFFMFYMRRRFKRNIIEIEKYYITNTALLSGNTFFWLMVLFFGR